MAEIGLKPVGSALLVENFDGWVLGRRARRLVAEVADPDLREMVRDFCIDQRFRCDVFARDASPLDATEQRERLLAAALALTRPPGGIAYRMPTPAGHLDYDNPAAHAIVAALPPGRVASPTCRPAVAIRATCWPTRWRCAPPAACDRSRPDQRPVGHAQPRAAPPSRRAGRHAADRAALRHRAGTSTGHLLDLLTSGRDPAWRDFLDLAGGVDRFTRPRAAPLLPRHQPAGQRNHDDDDARNTVASALISGVTPMRTLE